MSPTIASYKPTWKATRVEATQGEGIPDCLFMDSSARIQLVELKIVSRGLKVSYRPSQVAFHARHAGSLCWTLVENIKAEPFTYFLYSADQVIDVAMHGLRIAPKLETTDLREILDYLENKVVNT